MIQGFQEPETDPLADTHPTQAVRPIASWRRTAGLFSLLGAVGFTFATVLVLLSPAPSPAPAPTATGQVSSVLTQAPTILPTDVPVSVVPQTNPADTVDLQPTISPDQAVLMLGAAPAAVPQPVSAEVTYNAYDPFTRVPDRPRSEVIQYQAVQGDSINSIAQRFGLKPETIAWSNDRRIIEVLRPGDLINILPVDGVYHQTIGDKTIAEIAKQYKVEANTIIDSEYNKLYGLSPDTVLPSGTWIVVPGGQAEPITWNPTVTRQKVAGASGKTGGEYITFAPGQAGSCGQVLNPGGGARWVNPLPGAVFVRGFSLWHTGVDLAAPIGTSVAAANGGRVIFAGWNDWGYGYAVVLAHGPFTTLYGHLSAIYVHCGQDVVPGQQIAAVGTSGNSTGPHLHFEIRYNDQPTDPAATIGF